jgi:hypothetical protein
MKTSFLYAICTVVSIAIPTLACACDPIALTSDMIWAMRENGRNCSNHEDFGQINYGACNRDAGQLSHGFHGCQHGGAVGNFDGCPAGQQIDTARAVGLQWNTFPDKAKCGFASIRSRKHSKLH